MQKYEQLNQQTWLIWAHLGCLQVLLTQVIFICKFIFRNPKQKSLFDKKEQLHPACCNYLFSLEHIGLNHWQIELNLV